MNKVLEIKMEGWTATPRMPFILSGNAVCMTCPTYSLILGIIGCCLGRPVMHHDVKVGFHYSFDSVGEDMETRQRLEYDGKKIKSHSKGSDAYLREFHVQPRLIIWIDRIDWEEYFLSPVGTPSLGRSQDLLRITSVKKTKVSEVDEATLAGMLLPFSAGLKVSGQLVQVAEAYQENEEVGAGRTATRSRIFVALPHDRGSQVRYRSLYENEDKKQFYLHDWQ